MKIYLFVRIDIMRAMYEHITNKTVIVDCGRELHPDGEFKAMAI